MKHTIICKLCDHVIQANGYSSLDDKKRQHLELVHPEKRKELVEQTREYMNVRQMAANKLSDFKRSLWKSIL